MTTLASQAKYDAIILGVAPFQFFFCLFAIRRRRAILAVEQLRQPRHAGLGCVLKDRSVLFATLLILGKILLTAY